MRILGIDPGSRNVGLACIDWVGNSTRVVHHTTIKIGDLSPLTLRLATLFQELNRLIEVLNPQVMVVEEVFVAKNASSALKLGHARGVILLSGTLHGLSIHEYSPTEVKQCLVGHGRADKVAVAKYVKLLSGIENFKTWDESDAVAIALCYILKSHNKHLSVPNYSPGKKRLSVSDQVKHRIRER